MDFNKISAGFTKVFPGDFSGNLLQRQTPGFLFVTVEPEQFSKIKVISFNQKLSTEIGLGELETEQDIDFLGAQHLDQSIITYATAYAGHQFGNWAGQLGDGRAILAGKITNEDNQSFELQWKGAGATPYSRFADGRAVLRSSVREYLMSEAMYHLRVPTTRALSLVETGELVTRDMAYNGNPEQEKGAVVLRVAESFLRFGHFELLASRNELDTLQQLADYSIENYFSEVNIKSESKYLDWFQAICDRTATMIIDWYRVGFVHGVMNTDNMSILGLTIDYGPYSMLDAYDLDFTPNTTDLPGKRYAFGKQAQISHWNLIQLANALMPLVKDENALQKILEDYSKNFWTLHDEMLCKKFGFDKLKQGDEKLFTDWQQMLQDFGLDYTLFFTAIEQWRKDSDLIIFEAACYSQFSDAVRTRLSGFLNNYNSRLQENGMSQEESLQLMSANNPKFILRNYLLYEAIQDLENDDATKFNQLLQALQKPYEALYPDLQLKKPSLYDNILGCSQLSCSS